MLRRGIEHALHAAAVALLVVLAARPDLVERGRASARAVAADARTLAAWTLDRPDTIGLALEILPDARQRAWLAAFAGAGTHVRWSMPAASPLALASRPVADPAGGVHLLLASGGAAAAAVALRDAAGPIDSLSADAPPLVAVRTASLQGAVEARAAHQTARGARPARPALKRVLVLGFAGWESKFAIAALEERGWTVDSRIVVAPGTVVAQGGAARPDTARHAAVVVLDSSASALAVPIVEYVRNGGGLVVAGEGARLRALSPVLAGLPGRVWRPSAARARTDSLGELGIRYPIGPLRPDAVVLERRDDQTVAAARRERGGRVVQLADAESWRRRMAPASGSVERHRDWWARAVAAAAFTGTAAAADVARAGDAAGAETAADADPAPYAAARLALGSPVDGPLPAPGRPRDLAAMLFALIAGLLLVEWGSRRLRGVP